MVTCIYLHMFNELYSFGIHVEEILDAIKNNAKGQATSLQIKI